MGKNSQQVKQAMTLWLMLEELGYPDLIRTIHSYDNKIVDVLFNEALLCIRAKTREVEDTLVFSGLVKEPMNLRFFHSNTLFMYKRYWHVTNSVCDKIFGEEAAIEVDESGKRPVVVKSQEARSDKSRLNPDAPEFHSKVIPEEGRTIFLTFSNGHPLSHEEIFQFFTSKWGEVVQEFIIEHTHEGVEPLFGRIVFTSSSVMPMILNGQAKAKFFVNHKHLWARTYIPRRRIGHK